MSKLNVSAFKFIVLLGFISLCADATYEGAQSITGAYLGVLGASGAVVRLVAGLGELTGYSLRLLTGFLKASCCHRLESRHPLFHHRCS